MKEFVDLQRIDFETSTSANFSPTMGTPSLVLCLNPLQRNLEILIMRQEML